MSSPFLFDWVAAHAVARPAAAAVDTPEHRVTYGALWERALRLAGLLFERGVRRGDLVLLALPHVPAAVVGSLATQLLGACAVEVNREWGEGRLREVLRQTQPRLALVTGRDARLWGQLGEDEGQALSSLVVVHPEAVLPPKLREALGTVRQLDLMREDGRLHGAAISPLPSSSVVRDAEAPALLVYTPGRTGTPRGVVQTFRNVAANTRSIVQCLRLAQDDRASLLLPLFHRDGKSVLQTHLYAGGSVFLESRGLYPRVVLEALETEGCSGFAGVPLTFELLRRQAEVSGMSFRRLRYVTQAGGALQPDTADWVRAAFSPAELFIMYGQTEATARLSYLPPEHAAEKRGSIGIPLPGVELRIVDEAGKPVPIGQEGQLVARGDNVTPGYFQAPAETAAILKEGWLWTGDGAHQDEDGFFFLGERAKDLHPQVGHRVSPAEIEEVLATHPEVRDVAVLGIPEGTGGEEAVAFVALRESPIEPLDVIAFGDFCRERLPSAKVPRRFLQLERLPRTAAGKIHKEVLRAHPALVGVEEGGRGR